jgi:Phage stabilisation protein
MPEISIATQSYVKTGSGLPPETCLNLYPETDAGGRTRLFQVPGITDKWTGFTGGVFRGFFARDGLLGGDLFVVFGINLWRVNSAGIRTLIFTIVDDGGLVRFESSLTELVIVTGGAALSIRAADVATVSLSFVVQDVSIAGDRFVFLERGTDKFYWSNLLDARTVNPLNVARVGSSPDGLLACVSYSTDLYFFGKETIEVWSVTADATKPFVRRPGGMIEQGALSRDGVCKRRGQLFFVGSDRIVYALNGLNPVPIFNNSIWRDIELSSNARREKVSLWAHDYQGHTFLALDIPGVATYLFDLDEKKPHRRKTYLLENWRIQSAIDLNGQLLVSGRGLSSICVMSEGGLLDAGMEIEREFTVNQPLDSGFEPVWKLFLRAAFGEGAPVDTQAQLIVSVSDDRGKSFGSGGRSLTMGRRGDFDADGYLTRLGAVKPPGRIYKVRMTDPYPLIISGMWFNEVQA